MKGYRVCHIHQEKNTNKLHQFLDINLRTPVGEEIR